ncbi:MAG: hypothetical protein GY923_15425 [Aestuariibacter sp.]|nr:hypothetical protein [Aestuariibacter sp.]
MGFGLLDTRAQINKRRSAKAAKKRAAAILLGLFAAQLAYVNDPSKRKVAPAGRRSGKTTGNGRLILKTAEESPQELEEPPRIAFVAPTKGQAKRLMWGRLQTLASHYGCPIKFNGTELIAKHENGCEIWIMGADTAKDIDRLRGFAYVLIIIDESQAIGAHMDSLVDEVLDAALDDYHGTLALTGTPNASCAGFFHDACNLESMAEEWSRHHWTILDNSKFPRWHKAKDWAKCAKAFLANKCKVKKWAPDNPIYLREWLAKWVRDNTGMVYRYDPERNDYDGTLPEGYHWRYILGVDIGYDDAFACEVLAFSDDLPDVYEIESYHQSMLIPSQWAEKIQELREKYKFEKIMFDTGALGKAIAIEFRQRYEIPVSPAKKVNKFDYIQLLNGDLVDGKIHLLKGGALTGEMSRLQLAENKRVEDRRYPNNCCDSFLYAWREAKHWTYEPEEEEDPQDREERLMMEAAEARYSRKQRNARLRGLGKGKVRLCVNFCLDFLLASGWSLYRALP